MSVSLFSTKVTAAGDASEFVLLENNSKKQRILIDIVNVTLVTDATVANRYPRIRVYDKDGNVLAMCKSNAQPASQTYLHTFTKSVSTPSAVVDANLNPLPKLWLEPYQKIKFWCSGGVTGDSATIIVNAYTEKVAFTN